MSFISMYGTDGSGKSTLANEIVKHPDMNHPIIIGGSSYKEWLSDDIARDIMGNTHSFNTIADSPEAKIRLYEDIAIVCYGFAKHLSDKGHDVIIDSDPYLKRMIWGTLYGDEEQSSLYISQFNERMSEFLPNNVAPETIIGINVSQKSDTEYQEILGRLLNRASTSEHDPKDVRAIEHLDRHVRNIWTIISRKKVGSGVLSAVFSERLYHTNTIEYENRQTTEEELSHQISTLSKNIVSRIFHKEVNDHA